MVKKVFLFFITISLLALGILSGIYFVSLHPEKVQKIPVLKDAFPLEKVVDKPENPDDSEKDQLLQETEDDKTEEEAEQKPEYQEDVYSVHVCDKYTDGSLSVRNIRLGMTFRQVVDTELKNIGVYVGNDAYEKGTFATMASEDGQGQDLLPVLNRAVLGNACEIIYDFSADISLENGEKVPYLERVQYQFLEEKNVDSDKAVEKAFTDCFGKAETVTEKGYYQVIFEAPKETLTIYYSHDEKTGIYNLKYIIWEQNLS